MLLAEDRSNSFSPQAVPVKTLSIIGYVGMVGGLIGLVVTRHLFSPSPLVIALQVLALLLLMWARVTFGRRSFHAVADPTAGGLVTSGPYRFIRHPIYASVCLFTLAGVAAHYWSWSADLCGGLILGSAVLRIICEESLVTARYPEYGRYSATTWRMLPFIF
jgi:protein-S-isoprenylcysteine O-methyltransferase Ste14